MSLAWAFLQLLFWLALLALTCASAALLVVLPPFLAYRVLRRAVLRSRNT